MENFNKLSIPFDAMENCKFYRLGSARLRVFSLGRILKAFRCANRETAPC